MALSVPHPGHDQPVSRRIGHDGNQAVVAGSKAKSSAATVTAPRASACVYRMGTSSRDYSRSPRL
jgi:hypothetical protein